MNCVLFSRRKYQTVRNNPEGAPPNVADCTVVLAESSYLYTGSAITPGVTVKDADGNVLTVNVDYFVAYRDNTDVGQGVVVITGTGNYVGQTSKTFLITASAWTFDLAKTTVGAWVEQKSVVGATSNDYAYGLRLQNDGSLTAGMFNSGFARLTFGGTAFSVDGMAATVYGTTGSDYFYCGTWRPDGKKFYARKARGNFRVYNTTAIGSLTANITDDKYADETWDESAFLPSGASVASRAPFQFGDNGYSLYLLCTVNQRYHLSRVSLGTPYELSTAKGYTDVSIETKGDPVTPYKYTTEIADFCFSPDGNYVILMTGGTSNRYVIKYKLPSPWDISGDWTLESYADLNAVGAIGGKVGSLMSFCIDKAGTKAIVSLAGYDADNAYKYAFQEYNLVKEG